MAAHPTVVIDHGRIEIPEELRADPRFRDGARLQLVPLPLDSSETSATQKHQDSDVLVTWMSLRGVLAHSRYDPNAELEKEKQRELEKEAR